MCHLKGWNAQKNVINVMEYDWKAHKERNIERRQKYPLFYFKKSVFSKFTTVYPSDLEIKTMFSR